VGGSQSRPLILRRGINAALPCRQAGRRAQARLAVGQKEVQADFLFSFWLDFYWYFDKVILVFRPGYPA